MEKDRQVVGLRFSAELDRVGATLVILPEQPLQNLCREWAALVMLSEQQPPNPLGLG
jgi:hypothetical protein